MTKMPTRQQKLLEAANSGSKKANNYIKYCEARFGEIHGELLAWGGQADIYKLKNGVRKCFKGGQKERDMELAAWRRMQSLGLYKTHEISTSTGTDINDNTKRTCIDMPRFDGHLKPQTLSWYDLENIIEDLVCATYTMVQGNFVHGDIKPENILLKRKDKSGIVVADFGSGCLENEIVYTYIQSRFYRAPDIILGLFPYTQ